MWFVVEPCGIVCVILTYSIVLIVEYSFVRVGVWDGLMEGELWAFLNLTVFMWNVTLIFGSHFKCMTTEPGFLPRDKEELDHRKLAPELSQALQTLKQQAQTH